MMKKHKVKNPFKLQYGLSDMVVLSGSSIVGGVAAGMIGEDKKTNKNKLKKENNLTFPILSILTLIFLALGIWGIILLTSKSNPALFAPITAIALLTSVILGAIVTFSKLKWTGALYTLIIWPIFFIILLLIAPITHIVNSLKNSKKQLEVVIQNSKQNILKSEERAQLLNERLLQNQNELKQTKELILQLEAAFQ